jgi:hypothetical protein
MFDPEQYEDRPALREIAERIKQNQQKLEESGVFASGPEETAPEADPEPKADRQATEPQEPPVQDAAPEAPQEPRKAPASAGEPAAPAAHADQLAEMESRWRSADGIAKAAGREVRELREQLASVRSELDALKANPPAKPESVAMPDAKAGAEERKRRLTEALADSDAAEIVLEETRAASDERLTPLQAEIKALRQELEPVRQTAQQAAQAAAERRQQDYLAALDRAAPGWQQVSDDPAFADFLDRHGLLGAIQSLVDNKDAERVAGIIGLYQSSKVKAAPETPAAAPSATSSDAQRAAIREQAQPRQTGAASGSASGPRIYSAEQFRQLYRELGTGKYTPEQSARIKAELDAAYAEGRVRR